ncbi:MAG: response regulator transcription factor [Lachnospiraceae bacterium]|nr:response regulator transcription factor [Lachnospiraceae bacterium]
MKYQVLMIDDDPVIADTTAEYFNMFDIATASVNGYEEAVAFLQEHSADLLLLDINLGDRSGFELCKRIRRDYDMPIFFISARSSDDDVLTALNIGGDDYIRKPYTMSILLAKVKAALRRIENNAGKAQEPEKQETILPIRKGVSLDTGIRKIKKDDELIGLKVMEYKLLLYLLENRGRVISKDELLKNVWEEEYIGEGTLAVHVRHLREKLEADPADPKLIQTVWGVGYVMIPESEGT